MAAPLGRRLGLRPGAVMGGPIGRIPSLLRLPVSPRRFVNALLPRGIEDVLWGPEVMDAEIPAANGFFTARSLAKLYALLAHGGQIDGAQLPRLRHADRRPPHGRTRCCRRPVTERGLTSVTSWCQRDAPAQPLNGRLALSQPQMPWAHWMQE